MLIAELDREGWEWQWHAGSPKALYVGSARLGMHIAKSFVDLRVHTRVYRENGQRRRFGFRHRVAAVDDVDGAFVRQLRDALDRAESLTKRFVLRTEPSLSGE